jgi:carbon monoxide dehydrogenase subunit G
MQLTGKHILNAKPSLIWNMLMDPDTLARITPGITKLEYISDHFFKSVLDIKFGPVSGSFTGNLQMENILEQKGFTLKAQQNGSIGTVNTFIQISLLPIAENQTEIAFNGNIELSGLLATVGKYAIESVSNTLTQQFFINMEKELSSEPKVH